jgi:hypothetical protein
MTAQHCRRMLHHLPYRLIETNTQHPQSHISNPSLCILLCLRSACLSSDQRSYHSRAISYSRQPRCFAGPRHAAAKVPLSDICLTGSDTAPGAVELPDDVDLDYFDRQDLGRLRRKLRNAVQRFQREREVYLELVLSYIDVRRAHPCNRTVTVIFVHTVYATICTPFVCTDSPVRLRQSAVSTNSICVLRTPYGDTVFSFPMHALCPWLIQHCETSTAA